MMHKLISSLAAAVLAASMPTVGAAQSNRDTDIKAAMVLNFARYAEWGASRFGSSTAPVIVCVEQGSDLADSLAALEGKDVGSRRLHVRQLPVSRFDSTCHVGVFSDRSLSGDRLAQLNDAGVLTIGEAPNFSQYGAIEIVNVARQLRFRVNGAAARTAHVQLRSQLLRLALGVR